MRARASSRPPGGSTLITSAPMSASTWPQNGPAITCVSSRTRTSAQGAHARRVPYLTIEQALARELRGDVRADDYTRHLYAGDASLYASAPLLVAFPRDADDVAAAIRAAARFGVPVVTRGGGHQPRRPGRRRPRASCSTPRATWTRSREIDVGGAARARRAGRRPGRPQPRRRGPRARVRPRHLDLQPGHARRHDRQQLLRQPLDRLRHDDRPRRRARGRALRRLAARRFGPVERGGAGPPRAGGHARGPRSTAGCRRSCATTRARSPRTTRGTGASPAATGSTALAREFDLAKLVTGSEGTLAAITEATVGLIELPTGAPVRGRALRVASTRRSPPPTTRSRSSPRRSR